MILYLLQWDASQIVIWASNLDDLHQIMEMSEQPFVSIDDELYYDWNGTHKELVEIEEMEPTRGKIIASVSH